MNNKKLEKILKSVDLPDKISNEHKYELRRKLLNSNSFRKNRFWNKLKPFDRIAGGIIAIALMLFIFIPRSGGSNEVKDLLSLSDKYYAGFFNPGMQSNFNNEMRVFGKDSSSLQLKIRQVIEHKRGKYRLIAFDKSGETKLDEYLISSNKVYRTKSPKLFYKNTGNDISNKGRKSSYTIKIDSSNTIDSLFVNFEDISDTKIVVKKHIETESVNDEAFLIYKESNHHLNDMPDKVNSFYFPVNRSVDFLKFFSSNPLEIVKNLLESDTLVFKGEEFNKTAGVDCKVIENVIPSNKIEVESIFIDLRKIDSLSKDSADVKKVFVSVTDSISKQISSMIDSLDLKNNYQKVEQIKINSDNGAIVSIKYSVVKNGKKINLAEIFFNEQKIDTNPSDKFEISENFEEVKANIPVSI